ncbi:hypothetical protein WR25_21280 [Diploscapter pachys]|uniref:Serine/threonine-protein kinase TOR n=1 Tax=Diploscapter pachys TaxID=2018661 RepID=A0A2A2KQ52_9BILA|nr:hypothetical protein WR25_21280 [Diploscapter pachys]
MNSRIANSRLNPSTAAAHLDLEGEIDEKAKDGESPEGRTEMRPGRERENEDRDREGSREDRMRVQTGDRTGKASSKDRNRGDSLAGQMKTDLETVKEAASMGMNAELSYFLLELEPGRRPPSRSLVRSLLTSCCLTIERKEAKTDREGRDSEESCSGRVDAKKIGTGREMIPRKPIERLRSLRMDEKDRNSKGRHRYTQAAEVAGKYISRIKASKGAERAIVAQELLKFLSNDIKDETDEYIEQFYSAFDNVKTKESRLGDLVNNSNDAEDKKAGIFLIVCLAEHLPNMKRFLNFLLSSIEYSADDETLVLATRASSYLVQLAEHRFAGAVGCRELAIMTSTPFFLRANLFFRDIFDSIRDTKPTTRMAAVEALQAALSITSLREAKQKSTWFTTCYNKATETTSESSQLSGEDLYHSILLMLNELVRIADGKFERKRRIAFGVQTHEISLSDPVGWLTFPRVTSVVESMTARALVKEKFNEIMKQISNATCNFKTPPKQAYLMAVIMELLPRLTAFEECTDEMKMNAFSIAKAGIMKHSKYSLPAIGFLVASDPETYAKLRAGQDSVAVWRSKILQPGVDSIQSYFKDNASRKKYDLDDSVFVFIYLFVCAYRENVTEDIKKILPQLFKCPLSKALIRLLHAIVEWIPSMSMSVYDGLVSVLYFVLTGQKMPNKTEMSSLSINSQAAFEVPPEKVPRVVFALETLSEFNFHRHTLHLLIQYVSHGYLTCDSVKVRLAAVKCVCAMLTPFLKSFESAKSGSAKDRETRGYIRSLVGESLQCLVSVAVTDPVAEVRLCVINCFSNTGRFFLYHLAVPHMLELQFMSLHDEKLEIQEAAVMLVGKLAEVNPAMILPRLRKTLVEAVSQMAYSGQARLEQHSARVLMHIAHQNPKFLKPYMLMLLDALIPKLHTDQVNVDVTVHVLKALSELCIVGGSEIVRAIDRLFQRLTMFIADPSSIQRRQASLELIGRICQATAYVVDPYKDYPSLLDDLLRLLKSEMSSEMRKAAMRTIGILGAIDPYTHKVYTGAVPSADKITTALSLPIVKVVSDSRQDVADVVQWFNYEKCTLDEFYPAITIANLMMMVQDEAYSQAYPVISSALITIFHSLNESYPQYVEQVVPRLLEVTKASKGKPNQRALFLMQLATLVSVIKSHAKPYLPALFAIIADAWNEELIVKRTVISVIEQIGKALGAHFVPYISELVPYLLRVVQTDKSNEKELTVQVFLCTRSLAGNLGPHLHLILPPILSVLDDVNIDNNVRQEALSTVMALSEKEDLSQYAPRLMQSWHKCIKKDDPKNKLQDLLYLMLIEIVKQMWLNYYVFRKGVDEKLKNCGLMDGDWKQQYFNYKKLADEAEQSQERKPPCLVTTTAPSHSKSDTNRTEVTMKRSIPTSSMYNYQPPLPPNIAKQKKTNTLIKTHAQAVHGLVTKDEWLQWLTTLRSLLVKSSSSAAIRAAHPICDYNQNLAKELFNASYMSIWTEMTSDEQREMSQAMLKALQSHIPEVVQTVLNLSEFMDHSEKGPLPIKYLDLATAAEEMRAYAKALRYTELQILQKPEADLSVDDLQALITYANKLNVQENAAGVVRYAEMHNMQIPMQGRWYEKLNHWERALDCYEREETNDQDTTLHQLRCLEALGRWTDLNEKASQKSTIDPKMAVIAARGAWAVGDWEKMRKYVEHVTENSHDGSLLRAVLAIKEGKEHYEEAEGYINKVRDMFDSELSAMASESYERAYGAMVVVQQLSELEEAIEYRIRAERRPRIALLWSRRLQGCRENVEQWQRLIMLRLWHK